ncbi:MAG: GtrA family protein [Minicystis sp.]
MASSTEPRPLARFATFARSALTGGAATLVDLGVIAFAVGILHAPAAAANVPALLAGAGVQFVGNRHFAFRAGAGDVRRQAILFALTEAVTMLLNGALYHLVATHAALGPVGAVVARAITTNLVFVLWSYPVWSRIFQPAMQARESSV